MPLLTSITIAANHQTPPKRNSPHSHKTTLSPPPTTSNALPTLHTIPLSTNLPHIPKDLVHNQNHSLSSPPTTPIHTKNHSVSHNPNLKNPALLLQVAKKVPEHTTEALVLIPHCDCPREPTPHRPLCPGS
ncbi:hypothetical protein KC19_3G141300 [Ceratodon purpureus]|uniref:Uncharacterized protein n=1 Tax=Ceratodon purpureus TaxID=3225 RepID=A0A8T0IKU4_CERPU|nr:hypothetical protein KC19_3G141300 [Ceratodon purpureus]